MLERFPTEIALHTISILTVPEKQDMEQHGSYTFVAHSLVLQAVSCVSKQWRYLVFESLKSRFFSLVRLSHAHPTSGDAKWVYKIMSQPYALLESRYPQEFRDQITELEVHSSMDLEKFAALFSETEALVILGDPTCMPPPAQVAGTWFQLMKNSVKSMFGGDTIPFHKLKYVALTVTQRTCTVPPLELLERVDLLVDSDVTYHSLKGFESPNLHEINIGNDGGVPLINAFAVIRFIRAATCLKVLTLREYNAPALSRQQRGNTYCEALEFFLSFKVWEKLEVWQLDFSYFYTKEPLHLWTPEADSAMVHHAIDVRDRYNGGEGKKPRLKLTLLNSRLKGHPESDVGASEHKIVNFISTCLVGYMVDEINWVCNYNGEVHNGLHPDLVDLPCRLKVGFFMEEMLESINTQVYPRLKGSRKLSFKFSNDQRGVASKHMHQHQAFPQYVAWIRWEGEHPVVDRVRNIAVGEDNEEWGPATVLESLKQSLLPQEQIREVKRVFQTLCQAGLTKM